MQLVIKDQSFNGKDAVMEFKVRVDCVVEGLVTTEAKTEAEACENVRQDVESGGMDVADLEDAQIVGMHFLRRGPGKKLKPALMVEP